MAFAPRVDDIDRITIIDESTQYYSTFLRGYVWWM
jgi:hypothetical protein